MQITAGNLISSASPTTGGALVSSRTCKREGADSGMPRLTWLVCNVTGHVGLLHNASWKPNEQLMIRQHFEGVECNLLPEVALWDGK